MNAPTALKENYISTVNWGGGEDKDDDLDGHIDLEYKSSQFNQV